MSNFDATSTATEVAAALRDQIAHKTVLITGTSPDSLGSQAALAIAKHNPKLLIIAGRSRSKITDTASLIKKEVPEHTPEIRVLTLDLSSQAATKKAADEVIAYKESIDVLINCAGIMAAPYAKTEDGIETQFGVNHIGHFLFTNLIMGKMTRPGGRIVGLTSEGYGQAGVRFEDPNFENGDYNKWLGYGQSKTAVILFAIGLAKRLKKEGILGFSLHPGVIDTGIMRHMDEEDTKFMEASGVEYKSVDQGAATIIAASFTPNVEDINGGYWKDCQPAETMKEAPWTKGEDNADKLWALSEKMVGQKFNY